ncbi:MAG: FAD-dependent oxidoreductase [Acidobacteriota bacterium]
MAAKRILILGGGFAGIYVARRLEATLRPEEATIQLVNQENYWVYQPMLPEVISGSIGLTDIVSPIRHLCPRTQLIMREVENIDLARKVVTVSPGFRPRALELAYDYLVIALGGVTNFYGMPGMIEHGKPFRTLADALALRNHLIHVLEEADVETDSELRKKLLTFVVAGGGFSGVELMAEMNDFIHRVKRSYPRLKDEAVRCVLVHPKDHILPEMDQRLAIFAEGILTKRGVEILANDRVTAATSEKAVLKSGKEIPTKTLASTVPSAMPPVLDRLDCVKEKGRLLANSQLELSGHEGVVWTVGDCAAVKTVAGNPVPPTAQHATRAAELAADNIVAAMRGGAAKGFAFEGLGKLASLGHFSAIADIMGVRVSGFPAWVLWRTIYLMKMPGLNRKVRIGLDWLVALLFPPDLVQIKAVRESGIVRQYFDAGETIFHQGDLGDNVYVIEKGQCEVLRDVNGVEQFVADLGPGDYFGEIAVLGNLTRGATVKAATAMHVLLIPRGDFHLLKASVPAFGAVFENLATKRAAENAQSPAEPRIK